MNQSCARAVFCRNLRVCELQINNKNVRICYLQAHILKTFADLQLLNEPENLRICKLRTLKRSLLAHLCKLVYGYQVSLVECPMSMYILSVEDCCSTISRIMYSVPIRGGQANIFFKSANKKSANSRAHSSIANPQIC